MRTINENWVIGLLRDKMRFSFQCMRLAEERGDFEIASDYVTQIETLLDVYEDAKEFDFALEISFNRKTSKHELKKIEWQL